MHRVLVCGGRGYGAIPKGYLPPDVQAAALRKAAAERRAFNDRMDTYKVDHGVSVVIEGGAPGADRLAKAWADRQLIAVETYVAHWRNEGNAAGPNRNRRMLAEGRPDVVIAFPGGKGTAGMVALARAAGVPVVGVAA